MDQGQMAHEYIIGTLACRVSKHLVNKCASQSKTLDDVKMGVDSFRGPAEFKTGQLILEKVDKVTRKKVGGCETWSGNTGIDGGGNEILTGINHSDNSDDLLSGGHLSRDHYDVLLGQVASIHPTKINQKNKLIYKSGSLLPFTLSEHSNGRTS